MTETGEAVVVLPLRAAERVAGQLVTRHSAWLERHMRRIQDRQIELAARPSLLAGRRLTVGGVAHRVEAVARPGRARSRVRVDGQVGIVVELAVGDDRTPVGVLEAWLRSRARAELGVRVGERAAQMGLLPRAVSIRDQRSRWGSASRRGTLSFSWRLLLCPPFVIDYVVVHELAHLRVAGHSPRFWSLVERHVPDTAPPRRWLRDHSDELHHAID